jgi:hypothetical protein
MKMRRLLYSLLVAGFAVSTVSCNPDEPTPGLKPAPTISLSSGTASGLPGSTVSTSVTVDSPEGGKSLDFLLNGVADPTLPSLALNGTTTQTVDVTFDIPASAAEGTTYNLTVTATDSKDQTSSSEVFKVTASSVPAKEIVDVSGTITQDTHWTADKIYRLNGFVRVGEDLKPTAGVAEPVIGATATLTIDPGTVIYGKVGTPGGALVVHRGSKLVAIGTADAPIVFTSEKEPGTRRGGDWSGIVICGMGVNNIKASASTGVNGVEELEGAYGAYHGGGSNAAEDDNSGTLSYVRIEFAGYPINPNQEVNGLTLASLGSGTTVDHVQVTYANDDSYEWFGGSVNAKHLIAYKGIDDDFDTDNGYHGRVQFGLGVRDALIADQSGSNGFESDNDAAGTGNTPFTDATFSNMTIVGGKATSGTTVNIQLQNGAQIRRNSKQDVINSLITGYPNGIFVDNALGTPGTVGNLQNGDLVLKNNVLAGVSGWGGNGFGSAANAGEIAAMGLASAGSNHPNAPKGRAIAAGTGSFSNGTFTYTAESTITTDAVRTAAEWFATGNTLKAAWSDAALGLHISVFEPLNGAPTLVPAVGSALLTGADFTGYTGFEAVQHRGAFGDTDWTQGWVNWNPQTTDYSR